MRVVVHAIARQQVVSLAQDVEHGLALLPQIRLHRHDLAVDLVVEDKTRQQPTKLES